MLRVIAAYAKRQESLTIFLGLGLAVLYVFFAVGQLISFEKLSGILTILWPIDLADVVKLGSALLVVAEVFAIPYLLGMQLSTAMRMLSAFFAHAIGLYIVYVGILTGDSSNALINTGLGGSYVIIPGGWWLIWFGIGINVLLVWYTVRSIIEVKSTRKHY
jgi:hypothetical protein